jgi:hypothetical protein
VVVLAALLGGCGSSGEGGSTTVSLAPPATATAPEATTTTAAATTLPATTGLPGQEETVKRLYDAWFANDRVTAASVADPAAIDAMWQTARGDYSLYNKCSTGEFDTSGCLYRGNLGTIQFDLEKRGGNWVVAGAYFSPR